MIRRRIGFPTHPSSSPRSTDVMVPTAGTVGTPQVKSLSSWLRSPITQGYVDQETRELVSPYRQVGWINAAIRLKEQSMARLKLEWRVDEKPDSPLVTSGEVVDLFGRINPMISRNNVDLPAPFGPIRQRSSPCARDRSTSATAWMPPNDFERPRTASIRPCLGVTTRAFC